MRINGGFIADWRGFVDPVSLECQAAACDLPPET
jgi:starvation-inducible outer membrane lipoprotein